MEPSDAIDTILPNELHREYNAMIDDVLQTLDGAFGVQNNILPETMNNPPSVSSVSSSSSSPTFATTSPQQSNVPNLEGVHIKIVEEPAPKGLRFRYICEGRSAGSIPGIHSTPDSKTFPTIEIVGYEGEVKIVVSCVTKDEPYRPHPHNLVGKEGCEFGICKMRINGAPMRAVFSNLGIQCVKRKDIKSALEKREEINVDPFKTKFAHRDQPSSIDLNVVRLCFQAFIPIPGKRNQHSQSSKPQFFKLPPVVSEPIFDKKSINDLNICRLCSCSAKVTGGDTIFLLCEKVIKDDIKVRFYEERDNDLYWEDFGEFQQTDVHKQAAIAFKTPVYINPDVNHKVQVYIQLYRPSDGDTSEPRPFELYPDPDNLKRKRIKTGGNPMNLLREIQQIEQNQSQSQMQYNNFNLSNMDFTSIWNTPSPSSTTSANPELKPEPFLSPNYFGGTYRNTYQASPSPQPLSPMMNRTLTTPSPGLVRNSSAESNTQMSNIYNQSQMNTTEQYQQNMASNYNMPQNIATNQFQDGYNNTNEYIGNNIISPQQTPFTTFNPSFNRTSGGRFSPISTNDNNTNNQISNTSQLQAINIMNNMHTPAGQGTTNVHFQGSIVSAPTNNNTNHNSFANNYLANNLVQVHDQQHGTPNINMMFNQFPDSNAVAAAAAAAVAVPDSAEELLNNLMLIDTNDFVNINTEEFRISNLSIST